MQAIQSSSFWRKAWKPALVVLLVGAVISMGIAMASVWQDLGSGPQNLVFYNVTAGDLPIVVTERGNLESQVETTIRCEVENMSYDRSSGNSGTQIIFIVPNGSEAKEGDLLVELDSAPIRERLDEQVLALERAKYNNQITQNATTKAQAELNVRLAELQLEMFLDPNNGTSKLSVEEIERSIDDQRNSILESQMALELAKTKNAGMKALFELGYRGRSELEESRMAFLKAKGDVTTGVNRLTNLVASRDQYNAYEFQMQQLTLEGEVETAKRNLVQAETDNVSLLAQAEAARDEAIKSEQKERERHDKYAEQIARCKIYAPHDGMVVYARERRRSSGTEIAEGVTVRQRQELITLPDLSRMQVKTQIHEAVLDQIRPGLPTSVRIDAFPNRSYDAVVSEVAVVPASNYFSNVQTYECTVRILGEVEQLKPGMTAVAEMHVDRLEKVVSVPVQAVVQIDQETWCYVYNGDGVERRDLALGRSNDKFVHVQSGIEAGDRLILNPMVIYEETEEANEISPTAGSPDAPEIPADVLAEEEAKAKQAAKRSKRDGQGKTRRKGKTKTRPSNPGSGRET